MAGGCERHHVLRIILGSIRSKMKEKIMRPFYKAVLFSVLVMSGCYTPHYLPNTAPTPLFEKAGNVRLAGYVGTNSYDVHVAVSPIEHIGIIAANSVSFSKKYEADVDKKENEIEYSHGHRYYEGALGYYFSPFQYKQDVMKIEIFAGYGKGTVNGSLDEGKKDFLGFIVPTTRVDADYQQYYLQMNASFSNMKLKTDSTELSDATFEYGSIFRLNKTRISNFTRIGKSLDVATMEASFIQFGIFGCIGGSGTGLTVQTGWLFLVGGNNRPSFSPLFVSAGLRVGLW
jgi:hypothetical protein